MKISVNGKFVDTITLQGTEPEFHYAYAVFETLRTYKGKIFHLEDHLQRLHASAQALHITLPYTDEMLSLWLNAHCKSTADLRLKIIASPKNIYIFSQPLTINKKIYTRGVSLKLYQLERTTPTVKKIGYYQEYLANQFAKKEKYYDALLMNHKQEILEGAYCNFFYIKNDVLYTPRYNILSGITRQIVLQLAESNYEIKLQKIHLDAVLQADECFLTQTSTGIVPVVSIDKHAIANGKPGMVTNDLLERFNNYTHGI